METPVTAGSSRLPKTSLFQGRPSSVRMTSTAPRATTPMFETPNLTPIMNEKSFVPASTGINPQVVIRARKVAARLYYPPSPETPASTCRARSLFLSGLDARSSFCSSSAAVPEEDVATAFGEETPPVTKNTNALFSATAKKGNSLVNDEQQEQDSEDATVRMKGAGTGEDESSLDEEEGVQKILELLCVLGAAHRHLCQVRSRDVFMPNL